MTSFFAFHDKSMQLATFMLKNKIIIIILPIKEFLENERSNNNEFKNTFFSGNNKILFRKIVFF